MDGKTMKLPIQSPVRTLAPGTSQGLPLPATLAAKPLALRVRYTGRLMSRWVNGTGWSGAVGLGLLVFCAAFYLSWLLPEQGRLTELRLQVLSAQDQAARASTAARPVGTAEKLTAFYGSFPRPLGVPEILDRIYTAADRQKLKLDQAEYRVTQDNVGKLARYQITLPLKGTYPQIRMFVGLVLADIPAVSLENVQFERQKIGDTTVEAKIKLVLYLEQAS
jgi:hypothetical protein